MSILPCTAMILTAFLADSAPPTRINPAEFQQWFESASQKDLQVPVEALERARRFRYVFVGGFQNERMRGYFVQNIAELRRQGIAAESIFQVYPSSDAILEENLTSLREVFAQIAQADERRMVVIAHSRGACDALAFALSDPGFVEAHVEALFLVQGPFAGSALADYVLGDGTPIDRRMPAPARGIAQLMGRMQRANVANGHQDGIRDLTTASATAYWSEALLEHADAIPVVSPVTYYIEASTDPGHQKLLRKPIARYLTTYHGPNDGVVLEGDQYLPGLGTRLGVLDVGHSDLTHRFPAARGQRQLRRALIQAILLAVGQSREIEPAAVPEELPDHEPIPDTRDLP